MLRDGNRRRVVQRPGPTAEAVRRPGPVRGGEQRGPRTRVGGGRGRRHREAVEVDPAAVAGLLSDAHGVGAGPQIHRDGGGGPGVPRAGRRQAQPGPGRAVDPHRQGPGGALAVAADRVRITHRQPVSPRGRHRRDVLFDPGAGGFEPGDEARPGEAGVVEGRAGVRPQQRVLGLAGRRDHAVRREDRRRRRAGAGQQDRQVCRGERPAALPVTQGQGGGRDLPVAVGRHAGGEGRRAEVAIHRGERGRVLEHPVPGVLHADQGRCEDRETRVAVHDRRRGGHRGREGDESSGDQQRGGGAGETTRHVLIRRLALTINNINSSCRTPRAGLWMDRWITGGQPASAWGYRGRICG